MSIQIKETIDPSSTAVRENPGDMTGKLIKSSGSQRLARDIRRYCQQKASGRSVLIAGHRGAGKTTLFFAAYCEVAKQQRALSRSNQSELCPLIIPLFGPSLLPGSEKGKIVVPNPLASPESQPLSTRPTTPKPSQGKSNADIMSSADQPENATTGELPLVEVTHELPVPGTVRSEASSASKKNASLQHAYQSNLTSEPASDVQHALIQIILNLYRATTQKLVKEFRSRGERETHKQRRLQLLEMAAQLVVELDEEPSPARLRRFWSKAGLLYEGVLQNTGNSGQGLLELVALTSVSDAYQRINATITDQLSKNNNQSANQATSSGLEFKGSELLSPMAALLTGGAVGAGLLSTTGTVGALIAGVVAAIGAATVFRYSNSRVSMRETRRETTLVRDLSLTTLDRVLPVLIRRLTEAGLAPVFFVDELDKVKSHKRITKLIVQVKKLVAENAFFCFLADRKYYEMLNDASRSYGVEHTCFTNRLFVVYRADDYHKYLEQMIFLRAEGPQAEEYREDMALIPFILIHQAQMHPFDLQRILDELRNEDDLLKWKPAKVRSLPSLRFDLTIQTAIELVLEGEELSAEMDRDENFCRLAHDALYYLTRRWLLGDKEIDLSETGFQKFDQYMQDRMAAVLANDADAKDKRKSIKLPKSTVEFLFNQANELAQLLSDKNRFEDRIAESLQEEHYPANLQQALALGPDPSLGPILEESSERNQIYKWKYNPSGRLLVAQSFRESENKKQEALRAANRFESIETNIGNLDISLESLAVRWHIIPSSPGLNQVREAVRRLRTTPGTYSKREEDTAMIIEFTRKLMRSVPAIRNALFAASIVGSIVSDDFPMRWQSGIDACVAVLQLEHLGEQKTDEALKELINELAEDSLMNKPPANRKIPSISELEAASNKARPLSLGYLTAERIERVWQSYEARAQKEENATSEKKIRVAECLCVAANRGPAAYFRSCLQDMTLIEWSNALLAAISPAAVEQPKAWVVPAAIHWLGIGQVLQRTLNIASKPLPSAFLKTIQYWGSRVRHQPAKSVLIIRSNENSLTKDWSPDAERGGLVISADRIPDFWRELQELEVLGDNPPELRVAYESDIPGVKELEIAKAAVPAVLRINFVLFGRTRTSEIPQDVPYIMDPRRVLDLYPDSI